MMYEQIKITITKTEPTVEERLEELYAKANEIHDEIHRLEESESKYWIAVFSNEWHPDEVLRIGFCTRGKAEEIASNADIDSDYGYSLEAISESENELWYRYERLTRAVSALNYGYPKNKFEPVYSQVVKMQKEAQKALNTSCYVAI